MSEKFDNLIRQGEDIKAIRYFAKEYYDNGKMGHTRKLLIERVAERAEKAEAEVARLRQFIRLGSLKDTCHRCRDNDTPCISCDIKKEIKELEGERGEG